ncbi:YitT family protein [Enterococcus italicus]|uniref:YitT family protein n=1 Tax=Enterococcus italicus TaxID=246144 RepID=UPI0020744F9C|nr:YitT family protein [Enterococcus italicus]MCM6930555.1 YitT family protein [Enterococcus italicus]
MSKLLTNTIKIIIGSFIFAISVNYFAISNDLGEGGVTGITMILYYLYAWSPALTNLILNGILLIIGWRFLDKATVLYTILAMLCMSLFLNITHEWHFVTNQRIVAALGAGVLMGAGMGLIMLGNGTTAGSAIIAKLLNKFLGWNVSYALLFCDIFVVAFSVAVIGIESLILTVVSLYVSTKVLDYLLEGFNPKKAVTIISKHHEELAAAIDQEIERGITVFDAQGYYSKAEKPVLYIVISRQQLLPVTKIINRIDPEAFVIVNEVQSVIGEGFTRQIMSE